MRTLIIGDHFVNAEVMQEAIERTLGKDFGPLRPFWTGDGGER